MTVQLAMKKAISRFWKNFCSEEGEINMVAIVLIILVVIALAAIFKEQLTSLLNRLFQKIEEDAMNL